MCNEKTQAAMKTSQYAEVAQSVEQYYRKCGAHSLTNSNV